LRVFRIARVARLGSLFKAMPELLTMVRGMVAATRSVFSMFLVLVIIIYMYAVFFTQMLAGTETGQGCFDNVPQAMNCLLLDGVFADQASFVTKLLDASLGYYVLVLTYLFLVTLTVMNLLIGVVCEVVETVARKSKDEILIQSLVQ